MAGSDVRNAATEALIYVNGVPTKAPELSERLDAALQLSLQGATLDPEELTTALGEGWVAEEALAVGLYAVLATSGSTPAEHFRKAITVAINHSGDSDSTGSIAGNIVGAYYGEDCLPADWLEALEAPEVVRGMADRLLAVTTG